MAKDLPKKDEQISKADIAEKLREFKKDPANKYKKKKSLLDYVLWIFVGLLILLFVIIVYLVAFPKG